MEAPQLGAAKLSLPLRRGGPSSTELAMGLLIAAEPSQRTPAGSATSKIKHLSSLRKTLGSGRSFDAKRSTTVCPKMLQEMQTIWGWSPARALISLIRDYAVIMI